MVNDPVGAAAGEQKRVFGVPHSSFRRSNMQYSKRKIFMSFKERECGVDIYLDWVCGASSFVTFCL